MIARRNRYVTLNYPRFGIAVAEGSGCEFTDTTGRTYLDLFSGFGGSILGHCHPELVATATEQAKKLWHVGNFLDTEPQTLLAESIAELDSAGAFLRPQRGGLQRGRVQARAAVRTPRRG